MSSKLFKIDEKNSTKKSNNTNNSDIEIIADSSEETCEFSLEPSQLRIRHLFIYIFLNISLKFQITTTKIVIYFNQIRVNQRKQPTGYLPYLRHIRCQFVITCFWLLRAMSL